MSSSTTTSISSPRFEVRTPRHPETISPQQTTPPDVILQTLPDVVTSFLESPPASNENCGLGSGVQTPEPCSPCSTHSESSTVVTTQNSTATSNFQFLTGTLVNNMASAETGKNTMIKTESTELSNLGDLDSLNDLLGIAGVTGK